MITQSSRVHFARFAAPVFFALAMATPSQLLAELPPLIPRDVLFGNPEKIGPQLSPDGKRLAWIAPDVLFGNPEKIGPQLSPDGKRLAWIAPDKKNVLQVWVKSVGKDDDKIVTADKKRGIRRYHWAEDNQTLLYLQDADGDENWHIYGVDLASGNVRDYSPFQGVRAD